VRHGEKDRQLELSQGVATFHKATNIPCNAGVIKRVSAIGYRVAGTGSRYRVAGRGSRVLTNTIVLVQ
jgi:hypothetical protein